MIANVPEGDKADVDLAVRSARRAFDERCWLKVSLSERGRILWRETGQEVFYNYIEIKAVTAALYA